MIRNNIISNNYSMSKRRTTAMTCYRNSRRNIRTTTTTYYQYKNYRLQQLLLLVLVQVVLLSSFSYYQVIVVVNGMAPPYPELIEESNKHRLLHKQLYDGNPNVNVNVNANGTSSSSSSSSSYISHYEKLPSGIWESANDYKERRRFHRNRRNRQRQLSLPDLDPNHYNQNNNIFDNNDESELGSELELDDDNESSESLELCDTCQFSNEICRYLSHQECNEIEQGFMKLAVKTRAQLLSGTNSRTSTSTSTSIPETETGTETTTKKPSIRTLVILVLWADHTNRKTWITKDDINTLWNGIGTNENIIPTGSIGNYTKQQAYNTIDFVADIIDWQTTDNTESYYADGRSGMPKNGDSEPNLKSAYHYILNQMDIAGFDWNVYDSDNDGYIDSIQFLHSGYGAEIGGIDCYTGSTMENRIWAHAMPEGRGKWISERTGLKLGGFSTASVFKGKCDQNIAELGIMMHEFYHTLGLPDLYDRDRPYVGTPGKGGLGGLGVYDMMACPFGTNNDQMYPGSLSPWSKIDMGFIQNPIEIIQSGTYTIRPSNYYPDIYEIKRGYNQNPYKKNENDDGAEYMGAERLLIENRHNSGYDSSLWTSGILIYHIDEASNGHNGNKNHGYPGQDGWPSNGEHYPIALLQADGLYELENAINNGDINDFYKYPTQKLTPGNGELIATEEGIYPNTDSYAFGEIKSTGIVIDKFQETEQEGVYTFRVTFEDDEVDAAPPSPIDVPTEMPTKAPTLPPTDVPTSKSPTNTPTQLPTVVPTRAPTKVPSKSPTKLPTNTPTKLPSKNPTAIPSESPTKSPTNQPTAGVTLPPTRDSTTTRSPFRNPTQPPTQGPSPASNPTAMSTAMPTGMPTSPPTTAPAEAHIPEPTDIDDIPPSSCDHIIQVNITTDEKPNETTWEITSQTGRYLTGYRSPEDIAAKTLQDYTIYEWKICASGPGTSFIFHIYDKGLDGLNPPGEYTLSLDGEPIATGGTFAGGWDTVTFSTTQETG